MTALSRKDILSLLLQVKKLSTILPEEFKKDLPFKEHGDFDEFCERFRECRYILVELEPKITNFYLQTRIKNNSQVQMNFWEE